MLGLSILSAGWFCAASSPAPAAQISSEKIHPLRKDMITLYNKADARGLSNLWTNDGDCFTLAGGILRGRSEIEAFWAESFAGSQKGTVVNMEVDNVRMLSASLVLVDGTWVISAPRRPKARQVQGIYTHLLIKTANGWRIVAARHSSPRPGHTRNLGRTPKAHEPPMGP